MRAMRLTAADSVSRYHIGSKGTTRIQFNRANYAFFYTYNLNTVGYYCRSITMYKNSHFYKWPPNGSNPRTKYVCIYNHHR